MAFAYTETDLGHLETAISRDRMDRYLRMANGDMPKAILFYEMNNVVSESFFGVIRGFEVALRNSFHRRFMAAAHGRGDWYNHFNYQFKAPDQDAIKQAKDKIKARAKPETPGRVVALLGMGFWCALTARHYDSCFWVPFLKDAFPHKRHLGRQEAQERLDHIRDIRNRIAHHESVLHLELAKEHQFVLETIGWICPVTQRWVTHTSTLLPKLADLANMISPPVTVSVMQPQESDQPAAT